MFMRRALSYNHVFFPDSSSFMAVSDQLIFVCMCLGVCMCVPVRSYWYLMLSY